MTPKRARRHLLDRAPPPVAVRQRTIALVVLAAFAGVAPAADAVHRDRQVLVGLGADRAEAHGAGREALDDFARRLDLVERDGLLCWSQLPHAAQA